MRRRHNRDTVNHTFEELGSSLCWIDVAVTIEAGEPASRDCPASGPEIVDVVVIAWGDEYGPCKIHPSWNKTLNNIAAELATLNFSDILDRLL